MVEPVTLLGAARVLKKPLDDLYELGKGKYKSQLKRWQTDAAIGSLHKKIASVQKVKTIWQIDKEINIKSFYYPSRVILDDSLTTISQIDKLPLETNLIIQGSVGQGKSIFLRYLCGQELKIGMRIPVFCELRKIDEKTSLRDLVCATLKLWNFETDEDIFDFLCESGKFVLLLDGFDEIKSDYVQRIITELENWSERYERLKIVVTSRPDSGIERSRFFRVLQLAPLSPEDHAGIICKLVTNKAQQDLLIEAVGNSSTGIKTLLTTPLMITLLVLVYKSTQKIPEQFSEFYENLFQTLLVKRDRSKPGYSRERRCKINERKLQEVFEAFCFLSSKSGLTSIKSELMHKLSEEAISTVNISCDSADFIFDVTKICCLVVEEAFEYHFVHKSVREFHAANFIRNRSEEFARKFYQRMLANHSLSAWAQELNFLSQIDKYRFCVYFMKPHIENIAENNGVDLSDPESIDRRFSLVDTFRDASLWFDKRHYYIERFRSGGNNIDNFIGTYDPYSCMLDVIFRAWHMVEEEQRKSLAAKSKNKKGDCQALIILEKLGVEQEVSDRCVAQIKNMARLYADVNQYIDFEKQKINILDI